MDQQERSQPSATPACMLVPSSGRSLSCLRGRSGCRARACMLLTTLDCHCPGVPVSDLLHDEERDDALLRAATIGSVQGTRGWGSDPRLILPAVLGGSQITEVVGLNRFQFLYCTSLRYLLPQHRPGPAARHPALPIATRHPPSVTWHAPPLAPAQPCCWKRPPGALQTEAAGLRLAGAPLRPRGPRVAEARHRLCGCWD